MASSPQDMVMIARGMRTLYAEAEEELLKKIAKSVEAGPGNDPALWQQRKLNDLRKMQKSLKSTISKLQKMTKEELESGVIKSYLKATIDTDLELIDAGEDIEGFIDVPVDERGSMETVAKFGSTHVDAVSALIAERFNAFDKAQLQALRSANDMYRRTVVQSASLVQSGVKTGREAVQDTLKNLAGQGITGFRDAKGRNWNMASYAEMAMRTAVGRASVQGNHNRMLQQGRDLVIVSDHAEECPICRPWEGEVLSITGETEGYRTVDEAISAGLWHPNCGHTSNAYIEGLSQKPEGRTTDPQGYEDRQTQRKLERMVRKWKSREAIAITDREKRLAKTKVNSYQKALRDHTAATGRKRDYWREQVRGGNSSKPRPPKPTADIDSLTTGSNVMMKSGKEAKVLAMSDDREKFNVRVKGEGVKKIKRSDIASVEIEDIAQKSHIPDVPPDTTMDDLYGDKVKFGGNQIFAQSQDDAMKRVVDKFKETNSREEHDKALMAVARKFMNDNDIPPIAEVEKLPDKVMGQVVSSYDKGRKLVQRLSLSEDDVSSPRARMRSLVHEVYHAMGHRMESRMNEMHNIEKIIASEWEETFTELSAHKMLKLITNDDTNVPVEYSSVVLNNVLHLRKDPMFSGAKNLDDYGEIAMKFRFDEEHRTIDFKEFSSKYRGSAMNNTKFVEYIESYEPEFKKNFFEVSKVIEDANPTVDPEAIQALILDTWTSKEQWDMKHPILTQTLLTLMNIVGVK